MPIPLRSDFDAPALRKLARSTKDGPQARRLLALASIYEGGSRAEAARFGSVTRQIVRDWVVKFNALGPEGLIDRKPPGLPSRLNDTHRSALVAVIEWPHPCRSWGGALASGRSGAVALGRVQDHPLRADAQPGDPGTRLPQALGPPAPPRQERCSG